MANRSWRHCDRSAHLTETVPRLQQGIWRRCYIDARERANRQSELKLHTVRRVDIFEFELQNDTKRSRRLTCRGSAGKAGKEIVGVQTVSTAGQLMRFLTRNTPILHHLLSS